MFSPFIVAELQLASLSLFFVMKFNRLTILLLLGAGVRFIAAVWSKGFLTLDDHFNLVVDADMLSRGIALPPSYKDSILYPGIVSFIMSAVRLLEIISPDIEMVIIRFVHAGISLFVIYFVYKILDALMDEETATIGGLLMSVFYIVPIFSVHQFEEVVCQVPLLAGIWFVMKQNIAEKKKKIELILAGVFFGIALIIRFPLLSFIAPFLIFLCWKKETRKYCLYVIAGFLFVLLLQSISNIFINGMFGYSLLHNYGILFTSSKELLTQTDGYPAGPWYRYIVTLFGIFLPPFSILFFIAAFFGGKKYSALGISTLVFIVAHSLIANKQERFLLPILPVLFLLAAIGFEKIKIRCEETMWRWRSYKILWLCFIIINMFLLSISLVHYGKKDRVEPLVYLSTKKDAHNIVVAQYSYNFFVPDYYLGTKHPSIIIWKDFRNIHLDMQKIKSIVPPPNYLVLYSDIPETDRKFLEIILHKQLIFETTIQPSIGDYLAHLFNPKFNKSNAAYVYLMK